MGFEGACQACRYYLRRFAYHARLMGMSWTKPTYAECHPDRPYFAAGLCRTCYNKETYRCRRRATCHPERPRCSRDGLCGPCYQRRRRMMKVT